MKIATAVASLSIVLALTLLVGACGDDDTGTAADTTGSGAAESDTDVADAGPDDVDDRELFRAEVDGVTAVVADCFVSESSSDGRRYRTTVEVENRSDVDQAVTVTIEADDDRGGTGPTIDVPAGASDAWAVVSDGETTDAEGDAVCSDYITAITLTLDDPAGGASS